MFCFLCFVVSFLWFVEWKSWFSCFGDNTLKCWKTRTAFLYWRRWWVQPRHHKGRKARRLSSKVRSFVLQRSPVCWFCSQFSSAPLFLYPFFFFSLTQLTKPNQIIHVSFYRKFNSYFGSVCQCALCFSIYTISVPGSVGYLSFVAYLIREK